MEDHADEKRVAGFFPMVPALERALRIDQDVGDVLNVADLVRSFAHFEQRIVFGGQGIGWIEQQTVGET